MKTFELKFTEEQLNYILNAVAQRPYVECQKIIETIQQQVQNQPKGEVLEVLE